MKYQKSKIKNQKYRSNIKKNKIFNFLYVFFIFNILFFIFLPHVSKPSHAQSYSLSISPSLLEVIIKPGKSVSQEYKISNNADAITLTPQIVPLVVNRNTGEIIAPNDKSSSFEAKSWFSLSNEDMKLYQPFFLSFNQTIKLVLKIDIPENTLPADYYFHLLLKSSPPPKNKTSSSYISAVTGTNILISVSRLGTLNRTGEISQFQTPFFHDSFDTYSLIIGLKNTGAAFLKSYGTISLENPLSNTKYNILPQNILTNSTRMLQTTESLKENTNTGATLSIKKFLLGPQRISAYIKIEGTNIILHKSLYIMALPYKAIFALFLILGIYIISKKKTPK